MSPASSMIGGGPLYVFERMGWAEYLRLLAVPDAHVGVLD
jgi:hypothetical protein